MNTRNPPRVAFAGTPDFAVPSLQALVEARSHGRIALAAVYTQPDRPAGRGKKLLSSPVKQAAQAADCLVLQPQSLKQADAQAELAALDLDLLVVTAYGLILPEEVLASPTLGCVNVHASLLPRWRGAAPIQRAIQAGDTETGITLMQMSTGLDTGDMLAIRRIPITPEDTGGSLHDRLAKLGGELLSEKLDALLLGALGATPQNADHASYAHKLDKAEALIDWKLSAEQLHDTIRAFSPWPVASTLHQQTRLRIHQAKVGERQNTQSAPGSILQASSLGIDVQTGNGVLTLTTLQKPGGKPLAANTFLNGYPLKAGEQLR